MEPIVRTIATMKFSRLIAVVSVVFLIALPAFGTSATEFLKAKQAELKTLIQKPQSPANDTALKRRFDALLDYDVLAKQSLEDHWEKLSSEKRKEFQSLLETLVRRAYTRSIRDTLDYDIKFKGQTSSKGGQVVQTVATHKTNKRKEPIDIDYVLRRAGGSWKVVDIVTEGSSLVSNYRNQFNRVIEKKGFADLLKRMRAKVDEDD